MATPFTTTTTGSIEAFGATAHSAIDACRAGGERLGEVAAQRWDSAFAPPAVLRRAPAPSAARR
jgi:hypothetical protein